MSRITRIEQQKKNHSRYSLYLDDIFAFGVSEDVLIRHRLTVGMELDESFIEEVLASEEMQKVMDSALRLLSFRARSEKELRTRLRQKGYEEHWIEKTVEKLRGYHYINDESFARMYAQDRKTVKKLGTKGIQMELKQKGIDQEIIRDVVDDLYSEEDELEQAIQHCEKKARMLPEKDPFPKKKQKLIQFLVRKGYSFEIAGRAISQVLCN